MYEGIVVGYDNAKKQAQAVVELNMDDELIVSIPSFRKYNFGDYIAVSESQVQGAIFDKMFQDEEDADMEELRYKWSLED
jgi:DNA-directed RNA polymerase beta subunit